MLSYRRKRGDKRYPSALFPFRLGCHAFAEAGFFIFSRLLRLLPQSVFLYLPLPTAKKGTRNFDHKRRKDKPPWRFVGIFCRNPASGVPSARRRIADKPSFLPKKLCRNARANYRKSVVLFGGKRYILPKPLKGSPRQGVALRTSPLSFLRRNARTNYRSPYSSIYLFPPPKKAPAILIISEEKTNRLGGL